MGAGPIGCLHVRLARARGAGRVFLVDLNRERLDLSADRVRPDAAIDGADTDVVEQVRKLTDGRGADVVITAAASKAAQEQAFALCARQAPDQLLRRPAQGRPDDPGATATSCTTRS